MTQKILKGERGELAWFRKKARALAISAEQDVRTFKTHHHDPILVKDYSKVNAPCFDPEQKAKVRAEEFPIDGEKAFEMGARLLTELR